MIDNLVIAPAERYIVDLYAPDPGLYQITNMIGENPYIIATIRVEDSVVETSHRDQFVTLHENTKMQSDIDAFRPSFDKEIDKTLVLDVEMDGMMGGMGHGMMAGMDHG
ncbi:MAG: hypothetical protein H6766_07500 [Candidatus Peribacteria bacterium]|nr:MAG: hypothetical protein H6766_07500 [Candidatus Peribacteria bacterium]